MSFENEVKWMAIDHFERNHKEICEGQAEFYNKEFVGALVVGKAKEGGATRIYLYADDLRSARTNDGRWDYFTISDKPCEEGMHLFEIQGFRVDNNGYLNVMVTPKRMLTEDDLRCERVWTVFKHYKKIFVGPNCTEQVNIGAMIAKSHEMSREEVEKLPRKAYHHHAETIMELLIGGSVSFQQAEESLGEIWLAPYDQFAKELNDAFSQNVEGVVYEGCPRFIAKMKKEIGNCFIEEVTNLKLYNFLNRCWKAGYITYDSFDATYEEMKEFPTKAELYLANLEKKHEEQKAAKKAAKKAKKAAVKAAKNS